MSQTFKVILILLLAINLSTNLNAGREKRHFHNNYQTQQQQIHYSRMTKNDTTELFHSCPSAGLRITTPTQQAIAIMLSLSVMVSCIEAGPVHKKSLPYPFRVPESDEAVISDTFHNPAPCYEVKQPTDVLLGFIHPGLFSGPLGDISRETLLKECERKNLFKADADGQQRCFPDQQMMKTVEFDQNYNESGLLDRIFSDQAWSYLKEEFFPKQGQDQVFLPIKQFFGNGPKVFQDNIKKLNSVFQNGLSNEGKPGLEEFRHELASLFIRYSNEFPSLENTQAWEKYIQENVPHLLDSYKDIEAIANDLPRHLRMLPAFAHFADSAGTRPFYDRLNMAIEYIGLSRTVDDYQVLTENFDFAPSYTVKEFDKLFRDLRKETLKLFEKDPIKAAAYLHFNHVSIHPHSDANGRTARAIMNLILMSAGIEPVVFPSNNQYTDACVDSARAKSASAFEEFLRSVIATQQQEKEIFTTLSKQLSSCKKDCQDLLDSHF